MEKSIKHIPVLFNNKDECCGCSACYAICPKEAIKMCMDEEGFLYPVINSEECICCYRCLDVCRFKEDIKIKQK